MLNITLSSREKKLLLATLSIFFLAIFYLFILEPQIKKIAKGKRELKKLGLELKKNLRICQTRSVIEKNYLELRKKVVAQAPREEELSQLLSSLENSAQEAKILPLSIEPSPIKEYEFYRKLTVEMALQGDLASLTKFFYHLQYSPYRFIVDKLLIISGEEKSKLLKVQLSLSILLSGGKT